MYYWREKTSLTRLTVNNVCWVFGSLKYIKFIYPHWNFGKNKNKKPKKSKSKSKIANFGGQPAKKQFTLACCSQFSPHNLLSYTLFPLSHLALGEGRAVVTFDLYPEAVDLSLVIPRETKQWMGETTQRGEGGKRGTLRKYKNIL